MALLVAYSTLLEISCTGSVLKFYMHFAFRFKFKSPLLISFANSLNPGQAQHFLDPNCLKH